jgi:hypothetical protein
LGLNFEADLMAVLLQQSANLPEKETIAMLSDEKFFI